VQLGVVENAYGGVGYRKEVVFAGVMRSAAHVVIVM